MSHGFPTAAPVSFSCSHGEKVKRLPTTTAADAFSISRSIELYKQAARRLPLAEMPELEPCVYAGGNCLGLADPVSNIILNAVALLLIHQAKPPYYYMSMGFRAFKSSSSYGAAYQSLSGLEAFMAACFRYLSAAQARRYLSLASHDLALAIALVHHDRFDRRRLLPDGGRVKAALRLAAAKAKHPEPAVLARIMAAQYPSDALAAVLAKLRRPISLTTHDVSEIRDLLARQWPPPPAASPPPVSVEFSCRPNGTTCARRDDGALLLSTYVGEEREFAATILIQRTRHHQQLSFISDLTFDNSADMDAKLSGCLQSAAEGPSAAVPVDYDASPCEHIVSLKLCLLDAIHAMYIKALAVMPVSPRLLRAVLVGGHCYGAMDPVSNIIVNAAWYDAAFPPAQGRSGELPDGVFNTGSMSRVASRSLDGLVAMLRHCNLSEHEALTYVGSSDYDLSRSGITNIPIASVAKAARHPQHAAFGSFLSSLSPEKVQYLRSILSADAGIISHARWDQLTAILHGMPMPAQENHKEAASSSCRSQLGLDSVRRKLGIVLHAYCNQHPWEPSYKVDIVCGVWRSNACYNRPNVYHTNFLASTATDAAAPNDASSSQKRTLFFAEFWESSLNVFSQWSSFFQRTSRQNVELKPSICCPIYDYRASNAGRCSFCEKEGNKIIHPPNGCHSGYFDDDTIDSYSDAVHKVLNVGFEGLLDSDFFYVDPPDRDVEL